MYFLMYSVFLCITSVFLCIIYFLMYYCYAFCILYYLCITVNILFIVYVTLLPDISPIVVGNIYIYIYNTASIFGNVEYVTAFRTSVTL
jgi:ABC-type sulfate transport system permease subunit